jgi:hypothetical protein
MVLARVERSLFHVENAQCSSAHCEPRVVRSPASGAVEAECYQRRVPVKSSYASWLRSRRDSSGRDSTRRLCGTHSGRPAEGGLVAPGEKEQDALTEAAARMLA